MDYECALSGLQEEPGPMDTTDGLDDLPVGWTRVTFERRSINPKWMAIQQLKENMVSALMSQMAVEVSSQNEVAIHLQVEAQFCALETQTPTYLVSTDVVFISNTADVADEYNAIRSNLGLPTLDEEEEEAEVLSEAVEGR